MADARRRFVFDATGAPPPTPGRLADADVPRASGDGGGEACTRTARTRLALVVCAGVALVAAVALVASLQTEGARRAIMRTAGLDNADPHAPMQTRYAAMSGFFPFHFSLHGVRFVTATGDTFDVERADVQWAARGLFAGELRFAHVDVPSLRLRTRVEPARVVAGVPPWLAGALNVNAQEIALHAIYVGDEAAPRARATVRAEAGSTLRVRAVGATLDAPTATRPRVHVQLEAGGEQREQTLRASVGATLELLACNVTLELQATTEWTRYLWMLLALRTPAPAPRLVEFEFSAGTAHAPAPPAHARCPAWAPHVVQGRAHIDAARALHVVGAEARGAGWSAAANATLADAASSALAARVDAAPPPRGAGPSLSARLLYADGAGTLDATLRAHASSGDDAADVRRRRLELGTLDLAALPVDVHAAFAYDAPARRLRVDDAGLLVDGTRILGGALGVDLDASGAPAGATGELLGTSDAFGRVLDAGVHLEHNATHQTLRVRLGTPRIGVDALTLDAVEVVLAATLRIAAGAPVQAAPAASWGALRGTLRASASRVAYARGGETSDAPKLGVGPQAHSCVVETRLGDAENAFSAEARGDWLDGRLRGTWALGGGDDGDAPPTTTLRVARSPLRIRRVHDVWLSAQVDVAARVVSAALEVVAAHDMTLRLVAASLRWPLDDGAPFHGDVQVAGDVAALADVAGAPGAATGAFTGDMHVAGTRARAISAWHGTLALGDGTLAASPLGPMRAVAATLRRGPADAHWAFRGDALCSDAATRGAVSLAGRVFPRLAAAPYPVLDADVPFDGVVELHRAAGLVAARIALSANLTLNLAAPAPAPVPVPAPAPASASADAIHAA